MKTADARDFPAGKMLPCDILIVGGGAAGLTLALELAGRHENVIVLEAGGECARRRSQRHFEGAYTSPLKGRPLATSRWRALGGSTLRWTGQCGRMTRADFEHRPWVANSGWPFGLAQLKPYYERAEDLLGLGSFSEDTTLAVDGAGNPTLLLHEFRFPEERNFAARFGSELEIARNIQIIVNAMAVEIETDADARHVDSVRVDNGLGIRFKITARKIILAAGGIENARLLLCSRNVSKEGLGNTQDNVGRYFMDHPYFSAAVTGLGDANRICPDSTIDDYEKIFDRQVIKVIQFDTDWAQKQELVNCGILLIGRERFKANPSYLSPAVDNLHSLLELIRESRFGDRETKRLLARVSTSVPSILAAYLRSLRPGERRRDRATFRSTLEPVPDRNSRVRLSTKKDQFGLPLVDIDWRLGDLEYRSLVKIHEILASELADNGAGHVELRLEPDPKTGWPEPLQGGRHCIGTTRMHTSPQLGVVDANCKVHGITNLYVTGSSVFPTASYVNPTLTILALAIRLADQIL